MTFSEALAGYRTRSYTYIRRTSWPKRGDVVPDPGNVLTEVQVSQTGVLAVKNASKDSLWHFRGFKFNVDALNLTADDWEITEVVE